MLLVHPGNKENIYARAIGANEEDRRP